MRTWEQTPPRPNLSRKERVTVFMSTDGKCYKCHQKLTGAAWEAEHPQARELGGSDDIASLRPICLTCHKTKTADDKKAIAKCKRVRDKHIGAWRSKHPMPGSRSSGLKKKFNGNVERRP